MYDIVVTTTKVREVPSLGYQLASGM